MLLKRLYDEKLAQASFLVGCAATGEALVIDPNRDIDQYLRAAESEGVRITHVTETHIHADFVSGSRELAARTGAQLFLSDEGDANWKYAFAREAGARLVKDGDEFMVGNLKIEVLHTPGHTPEHISFMLTDTPATNRPMGVFTGDFVFAGDVGRPDLLERAANFAGTMEAGARTLFHSLQRFKQLPDYLQLWPGHGAGSACGKSLGAVPSTTLGYEKIANWGLTVDDESKFVEQVLAGQPEPPKYFAEMKRINKEGPRVLHGFRRPERLPETRLPALIEKDAIVVDTRSWSEFAVGHVPGTINIPLNKSFTTWAGWLVPYDRPFYLILDDACQHCVDEAVRDLAMIGLDQTAGYFGRDAIEAWAADHRQLASVRQMSSSEVAAELRKGNVAVIDVRGASEWEAGHLPGVPNIPLGYLADRLSELPRGKPLVMQCQGGTRSAIATSLLRAKGIDDVINLVGGFADWQASGHPVERGGTSGSKGSLRVA
ncbi:MAG TPA: rhodanese-like domain-containing protein [Gemmatimonadaceae bacterium]|nr:rhodanese-like domain-containing protein [Gemmatimonadaceae bacterium]